MPRHTVGTLSVHPIQPKGFTMHLHLTPSPAPVRMAAPAAIAPTAHRPQATLLARWLAPRTALASLWQGGWVAGALALCAAAPVQAQVTQFEVLSTQAPALQARSFGERGTARKITARATFAVDPADPRNAAIADIALAPRNAAGRVTGVADVVILQPQRPNGTLLIETPNRGRKLIGPGFDDAPTSYGRLSEPADAGAGFLLAQGYTLAWIGWQGDLPASGGQGAAALGLNVPTLPGITGPSRDEWVFTPKQTEAEQTVKLAYPAATREGAQLTVRARVQDPRTQPAGLAWRFVDDQTIAITRPAHQPADAIYEFTYTARGAKVMGLGLAALRDIAHFLRHDTSAANPLAAGGQPTMQTLLGTGISQSGRVLRDFVYLGFNESADHRPVYDGLLLQIPGGRRSYTNARFAQPARNPGPNSDDLYPVDQFPMAYATSTDAQTGRTDGLLQRCTATSTCPRIMQVDSEYEMWASHGSQSVTDPQAQHLPLPANVRAYLVAGTPHFAAFDALAKPEAGCLLPTSPIYVGPLMRALLTGMNDWVRHGTEPPASHYPNVADGTLVPPDHTIYPGQYHGLRALLGYQGYATPSWRTDSASGLPTVLGHYPVLVPRTDADGLALGTVRLPAVAVPRATYVGWNAKTTAPIDPLNPSGICTQQGSTLPLAATRAERLARKDPRPSIAERYPTPDAYTAAVRAAAWRLEQQRLLLPADAQAAVRAAEAGTLARLP